MHKSLVGVTLATLTLFSALSAGSAAAQEMRAPRFSLLASANLVQDGYQVHVTPPGGDITAEHASTGGIGLGLQMRTPIRGVELRASVVYSRPMLSIDGQEERRTSVQTGVVDAVVRLPRILDARPYLLAGIGARRYDFKEEDVVRKDAVRATAHLGAGLEWDVGRYSLYTEAGTYYRYLGAPESANDSRGFREATVTAGLRIPLRF